MGLDPDAAEIFKPPRLLAAAAGNHVSALRGTTFGMADTLLASDRIAESAIGRERDRAVPHFLDFYID
jgi:hypothetical protein